MEKVRTFLDKYLIVFIVIFGLLTFLPYVSYLVPLRVSHTPGIVYRGILLGLLFLFFLLVIIVYRRKLPLLIYGACSLFVISQIITISLSPYLKSVEVPSLTLIMGFAQALVIPLSVVCYLTIKKCTLFDKRIVDNTCIFMIILGILLCLYSYIFQYEAIYHTFNTIYGWNYDVTSIFIDKTEYGFILFLCSLFSIFYILNNKKYWLYIVPLFFLANMFISRSKTSILCTSIILITLFMYHIVVSWNKYKKQWIITFISFGIITLIIIILTALKVGWFDHFNYYLSQVIFNDGLVVFEDRFHKWSLLIKALDTPFNIIFGYGERITPLLLNECGCAAVGDNIYITNYGTGGIIKLLLYLVLACYVIVITYKSNTNWFKKISCLVFQLSFLVSGLFEDDSIVGVTMSGLFSSIIFYSCNKMIKVDNSNY